MLHKRIKRYWIESELAVVKGEAQTPTHTLMLEVDLETWTDDDTFDSGELDDAIDSALKLAPNVAGVRVIPVNKRSPKHAPADAAAYSAFTGKRAG